MSKMIENKIFLVNTIYEFFCTEQIEQKTN